MIRASRDRNAGEIVCIFDAFDECNDFGKHQLIGELCKLSHGAQTSFNLKILVTGRPYSIIQQGFRSVLHTIHLNGDGGDEMEKISQEIDLYIKDKVRTIGAKLIVKQEDQDRLLQRLTHAPNRTYLWVYLTLNLIENEININKARIDQATTNLPRDIDEAYEKILSKSRDPRIALRFLHIVVAATRPLTLEEMNFALTLQKGHQAYGDLDLKTEEWFCEYVQDLCGLFVTVVDKKIYLLHQTAKVFLVPQTGELTTNASARAPFENFRWKQAFLPQESHGILAEICISHLLFTEFDPRSPLGRSQIPEEVEGGKRLSHYADNSYVFLDYSAKNWVAHLHSSRIKVDSVMESVLKICDVRGNHCPPWFRIYWTSTDLEFPKGFSSLMLVSYFGLTAAARRLLKTDPRTMLNDTDDTYRRSALSWACENGFDTTVEVLLRGGGNALRLPLRFSTLAEVGALDKDNRSPLWYAASKGHVAVVKLLLATGETNASNANDWLGGTPLSYAMCCGHEEVVKLLTTQTTIEFVETARTEALCSAIRGDDQIAVKLLLNTGKIDINAKSEGQTPLSHAAQKGEFRIVERLLDTGKVDVNARDKGGQTPLSIAAQRGYDRIVERLLDTGKADVNARDLWGRTPLSYAAEEDHDHIVGRLLNTGKADVDASDDDGRTPLSYAAENGYDRIVKRLRKADVNVRSGYGRTPLSYRAAQ